MTTPIVVPTEAETAESARRVLTGVTVLLGVLTLGLGIAVLAWPDATLFVVAVVIAIQLFGFGIVQIIRSFADVTASGGTRTLVAIAGALVMSTVAIGAAVGPAQANANPVKVSVNA